MPLVYQVVPLSKLISVFKVPDQVPEIWTLTVSMPLMTKLAEELVVGVPERMLCELWPLVVVEAVSAALTV